MPQRSAVEVNPLREGLRVKQGPEPCVMVIFGATGDLTHRKLLPALYNLALEHPLPAGFSVVEPPGEPYNGKTRREWVFQRQVIECWKQFPMRQVAGRLKNDHDTGLRSLFDA